MTGLVGTVNKENKDKSIHFKIEEPYIKAMTVEYVHKAKTMHKISLSLRILKSGVTVVTSSAVERGSMSVLCQTASENANIFSEPCLFGYSYVCNSPFSSEDRASMCPVDKERRFVFCIHF